MLPAPAKFLQKNFGIFYFSTMVAQNVLLKHTTKQELSISNRLERFFMSLVLFVAHRSSNDKCPELPACHFFQWCSNSELYYW